jgi:CubicO group peptidase (beta-lactamase class C family)
MPTDAERATQLLGQKLRETIAEVGVPALAAVLVRDSGSGIVSGQQGIRKVGASGPANDIQPSDKFNLGSVTKVFTGMLMARLIHENVGNLTWQTKIVDVFPNLPSLPGWQAAYADVAIEHLITHCSGMPFEPNGDDGEAYKNWPASELTKPKLRQHRKD